MNTAEHVSTPEEVTELGARLIAECFSEAVERLGIIEIAGGRPPSTTTAFILISAKDVTSERPMALLHTWIRWWEWLLAFVVSEWKGRPATVWVRA